MSQNRKINDSDCAFAEHVISYIYGEIDGDAKADFETHLSFCSACSEELKEFNAAHFSILEWKREEFSLLKTPEINIPYYEISERQEEISISDKVRALFIGLRNAFNRPIALGGAVAVLLIISGVFLFVSNFNNKNQQSAFSPVPNLLNTNSSLESNVSETALSKNLLLTENENAKSKPAGSSNAVNKAIIAKDSELLGVNKKSVGFSNNRTKSLPKNEVAAQNSKNSNAGRKIYNSNLVAEVNKAIEKQKAPKLNSITDEDDEDMDLRLADLLEEIGGK